MIMAKRYFWAEETLDNVLDQLKTEDAICFRFRGKDYFIDGEYLD